MGGKTISTSETKLEALQLQSSAYGVTVALCYGMPQIPGNLAWYGGFKATPHTTSQSAGGKGGTKTQNTTYTYTASVMMGLCHGVINGIPRVWRGKEQFYGGVHPAQLLTVAETFGPVSSGGTSTVAHSAAWRATVSVLSDMTGSGDNAVPATYLAEGVHYTVAAGVYTWLADAAGMTPTIAYQYTTGTVTQDALAQLGLSFISGAIGQAVWSPLSTLAPAQAIGYSGLALVAGQDYSLGTGAQVDNHLFEVQAPMAYSVSSSTPDADPADIVGDVLLNARYGAGMPAERLGNLSLWSDYNRAAGLLCSPGITEQVRAADLITMAARLTNTGVFWSGGRLKFVPYGDTTLTGNGRTYTPNVTPLHDLTDDHYLNIEVPVDVQEKAGSDRFNHIRIEFRNRGTFDATKQVFDGQYAVEIAEAKDQADIEANGLRSAPIEQMHWLCDAAVASAVAYLLLYRGLFVANDYVFQLPWTFGLVEPMDLLTLTDLPDLNKRPVRVIAREEADDNTLTFTAEDFPLGIATATQYANPLGLGFAHDYNASPGPISAPVIFEAPGALVPTTGLEVYVAATGTGALWGGCTVWVSLDGVTYRQAGRLLGGSRYGALTGAISSGVLPVSLLTGKMLSGSAADATQLNTLCYVAGATPEYLAYQTATLTGTLAYSLSGLVRGAYGSPTSSAHAAADKFVRVDDAIAKSGALDLSYIGKTIHVKCTSFNVYGGGEENLATVTDYTYTLTGVNHGYGRPKLYRAVSTGFSDTTSPHAAGLYNAETDVLIAGGARSYMVDVFDRVSGAALSHIIYDIYAGGADVAAMVAALNALAGDKIVVVRTLDEPQGSRLTGGLDTAMYRCGASKAVFGSANFKVRGAYLLIGYGGMGEGNGFESYCGDVDAATTAWVDVTFEITANGLLITPGGGATPKTYDWSLGVSGTGKPSDFATADLLLINRNGMAIVGNTVIKTAATAAWDSSAISIDGYTGGAYVSFTPAQTSAQLMIGLNTDRLTDDSYTSLDFAWYCYTFGGLTAYESGVDAGLGLTYAATDVLAIVYDGVTVKYLQNGVVRRTAAAAAAVLYFLDSSFYTAGGAATNLRFGPLSAVTGIDTGQLASGAATNVTQDSHDFASGAFGHATARTVVVTPVVACIVEFTGSASANNLDNDGGNFIFWRVTPAGGSAVTLGGSSTTGNTNYQTVPVANSFAAAAGVALTFELVVSAAVGSIRLRETYMRITEIKR